MLTCNLHICLGSSVFVLGTFRKNKPSVIRGNYGRAYHNIWLTCWKRDYRLGQQMQTCRGFICLGFLLIPTNEAMAQYFPTKSLNWCCNINIYLNTIQWDFTIWCENRGRATGKVVGIQGHCIVCEKDNPARVHFY